MYKKIDGKKIGKNDKICEKKLSNKICEIIIMEVK